MSGVTDALIRSAQTAAQGDGETYQQVASQLRTRYEQTIEALL